MSGTARSERFQFRIRPHELDAIREAATQIGKNASELAREATLDAVRRIRENEADPIVGPWRADLVERSDG